MENLYHLSNWISRKYLNFMKRRENAVTEIEKCGSSREVLKEQWALQVKKQTEPAPRESISMLYTLKLTLSQGQQRNAVRKLVGSILLLKSDLQAAKKLKRSTRHVDYDEVDQDEVEDIDNRIRSLERQLGSSSRNLNLEKAENDEFLRARLKALAIKRKLLPKLVSRKFEAARLNHGYHKSTFGE
jgi:hypothetical protein